MFKPLNHQRETWALAALVAFGTGITGCPLPEPSITLYTFVDSTVTEAQTIVLAADVVGVNPTKVVFYDADQPVAEVTDRPYHYAWPVDATDNGLRVWTVHAHYTLSTTGSAAIMESTPLLFDVDIEEALLAVTPRRAAAYENSREVAVDFGGTPAVQYGLAPGSDNWPVTWARDGHQYTAWGDGGGFGGTNGNGRVSLGIGRIVGDSPEASVGENLWGGLNPQFGECFPAIGSDAEAWCSTHPDPGRDGKSYGVLALDDYLYVWICPQSDSHCFEEERLYRVRMPSEELTPNESRADWGQWDRANWAFRQDDPEPITTVGFLQYGKNYQGNDDGYVYAYATYLSNFGSLPIQRPGQIALMRIRRDDLNSIDDFTSLNRDDFEYYAGTPGGGGSPSWTHDFDEKTPVFENPADGVGWTVSVSYNPGLRKYILATEHSRSLSGNLSMFESDNPWGPWKTVYYGKLGNHTFYWNISTKWLTNGGHDFALVHTGTGIEDDYLVKRGRFITP